jgi:hypothetical protein
MDCTRCFLPYEESMRSRGRIKIVLSGESDNVCLFEQGDGYT